MCLNKRCLQKTKRKSKFYKNESVGKIFCNTYINRNKWFDLVDKEYKELLKTMNIETALNTIESTKKTHTFYTV